MFEDFKYSASRKDSKENNISSDQIVLLETKSQLKQITAVGTRRLAAAIPFDLSYGKVKNQN